MTIIRIEFNGSGGEYVIGSLNDRYHADLEKLRDEDVTNLFDHDDLLHCYSVNLCSYAATFFVDGKVIAVEPDDVAQEPTAIGPLEFPPSGLAFLVGCSLERGHLGSVEFTTQAPFDAKKLLFRYYDLEEWGLPDNNPLASIMYDEQAFTLNPYEAATSGDVMSYCFRVITTDADGMIAKCEDIE